MTDTEDPNIATLREALDELRSRRPGCPDPTCGLCKRFNAEDAETDAALARLASTLAERDRRIAEQQSLLRRFLALTFEGGAPENLIEAARTVLALEAPPAPAPGELAEALKCVRLNLNWSEALDRVYRAAESWQRLQWRPASEAPLDTDVVVILSAFGNVGMGERTDKGWRVNASLCPEHYIGGWLPKDALPALNGGDDNG